MSIVVEELAGSKLIEWPPGTTRTAQREFLVYDDEDITITHDDIMESSGLPTFGEVHPDAAGIFAGGYSMRLHEERANTWTVTWSYTVQIFDGEVEEDDVSFSQGFSVSIGQNIIDIWRSNPTIPSSPSNPGVETDIGGTPVHSAGHPISMALPKADISVKSQIITSSFNGYGLLQYVSKRNNAAWIGFPAGSVLFTGVNINKVGNVYELDWSLTWDNWAHLRQVPARSDIDGDIDGLPDCEVYFRQPFPTQTSFAFLPQVS